MKRQMIAGLALGILTVGALSASAAEPCEKCAETQSLQQFKQETAELSGTLKSKDRQLRELYTYDSIDIRKVKVLEDEMRELKDKIEATAQRHGIHSCNKG